MWEPELTPPPPLLARQVSKRNLSGKRVKEQNKKRNSRGGGSESKRDSMFFTQKEGGVFLFFFFLLVGFPRIDMAFYFFPEGSGFGSRDDEGPELSSERWEPPNPVFVFLAPKKKKKKKETLQGVIWNLIGKQECSSVSIAEANIYPLNFPQAGGGPGVVPYSFLNTKHRPLPLFSHLHLFSPLLGQSVHLENKHTTKSWRVDKKLSVGINLERNIYPNETTKKNPSDGNPAKKLPPF